MYIGNTVQNQGFTPQVDFFSGNASTTAFTLSRPVASTYQMIVVVANVVQNPGSAYTVSGNTITFSSAPPTGTNNIWVEYTSLITQVIAPSPGTVGSAQLQSGVALANLGYTPINKAGDTGVGTLALASNAGITFNNSNQYSGTTSSTLNDYETGTWTPTFSGATIVGSVLYQGIYTKIGNIVTANFQVYSSSGGTIATVAGTTQITNLPFAFVGSSTVPFTCGTCVNTSTSTSGGFLQGGPGNKIYFCTSLVATNILSGTITYQTTF